MATAIADRLIDRGLKQEDVSKVIEDMSSYYNRINLLERKIKQCDVCFLRSGCLQPITGVGSLQPEILVVSDHPPVTKNDLSVFEMQFVMMTLFSRIPLSMEDIYWTHAVKCPAERVTMKQIKECRAHLVSEIVALRPVVIVTLGTVGISSLTAEHIPIDEAIGGKFHFSMESYANGTAYRIPVIPVYHPRVLIKLERSEFKTKMDQMWENIRVIADYL